jgi:CubicO group peptidase (beta-lactamase class C family)
MHDLAMFYERLLDELPMMKQRHREGVFDRTFQHTIDFGLGLIIDSNRYGRESVPYGFGRYCSEESFGHGGAQSSIGFADPEHRLAVSAAANGLPGEVKHNRRFRDLNSAIYQDLGLAGND